MSLFFGKRKPGEGISDRKTDRKKTLLNMAAMPLEIVTGQNFYDPNMRTRSGQSGEKIQDSITGTLAGIAPAALNVALPGAGTALQMAQGAGKLATGNPNQSAQFAMGQQLGGFAGNFLGGISPQMGAPNMAMNTGGLENLPIAKCGGKVKMQEGGPTYEAENNEMIMGGIPTSFRGGEVQQKASNMFKLKGNTHEKSGIDMKGGKYVFSDSLTLDSSFLKDL